MTDETLNKRKSKGTHLLGLFWVLAVLIPVLVWNIINHERKSDPSLISPDLSTEISGDFLIQLQSRKFTPQAEIKSGLSWLNKIPNKRVHALLQLYRPPNLESKTLLEQSGVQLLNYIPSNTWFSSLPKDLKSNSSALNIIRWFGPILPEDKMPVDLLDKSRSWASRGGNKIALEVTFFEDEDLNESQQVLLKHDAVILGTSPLFNRATIEVSRDNILPLAKEDSIRWIDFVPPPATVDLQER